MNSGSLIYDCVGFCEISSFPPARLVLCLDGYYFFHSEWKLQKYFFNKTMQLSRWGQEGDQVQILPCCQSSWRNSRDISRDQDYQVYQDSGWKKYFWNCPQLVVCSQTSPSGHSGLPWVVNFAWLHSSCLRHEVWMLKRDKGKVSLRKWRKWSGVFLLATLENKQLV